MVWQDRTRLLVKDEGIEKLRNAHVLVAGLGGVGAFAAEMLCRAGIGKLTLIDHDSYNITNLNRQIGALHSTLGMSKAEVIKARLLDINPDVEVNAIQEYLKEDKMKSVIYAKKYSYIVDAIDTFSPKTYFIYHVLQSGQKLVSSMGSGGKTRPEDIRIADFSETYECRLAYMLRKRLRRKNVHGGFKAVFSVEKLNKNAVIRVEEENKKSNVGTISYMPSVFGGFCVSVVINYILSDENNLSE